MKFKTFSSALVVALVLFYAGFFGIILANAGASIDVDTTADELNTDGDCSLREAIHAANTDAAVDACPAGNGADTIHIPAGVFLLTIPGPDEGLGLTGDLDVYASLTLLGAGAGSTVIDGNHLERVMEVYGATNLTITGITLQNGQTSGTGPAYAGGGIAVSSPVTLVMIAASIEGNQSSDSGGGLLNNGGTVTLNNVRIAGNRAAFAGGIRNTGLLTINDSTVSGNQATTYAGGIMSSQTLNLTGSTVNGNSAGTNGGGIYIYLGTASLTNSTISGNMISGSMGGGVWIYYQAEVSITNTTVTANQGGAGLFNYHEGAGGDPGNPNILLKHTILAGNTPVNCGRTINAPPYGSQGHNLDSGHACGLTFPSDLADTNPLLGPLQTNGGPTFTHALQAGSPAIDSGDNAACPATDQRGVSRPVDGNGDGTAVCDMGAYEYNGVPPANNPPTDISLSNTTVTENQLANTVMGALTASDPDAGATFTFSLACMVAGADDASFNILGTNLRTSASFDFETKSAYNICIRVTDQGRLSFDENFVISVNNLNEAPTGISLSANSVDENQPVNTVVGALTAADPDASATFTFSLACTVAGADDASFNILGTNLRTSAVFNFETKSAYQICVRVTDEGGLTFDKSFVVTVINATFADVPSTHWARQYIGHLYNAGITGGCATTPLSYCPENSVTRAQMAVFLERGIHFPNAFTPSNVSPTFTDTVGHWAEDWIEALRSDGMTGGCGTNLYCPEDPVTRAQMAVFLLKSKYGSGYIPPAVGANTGFNDVSITHWAAPWVKQLAIEGITGGCGTGIYCPESPVTRAQMAVFLVRTFNLP